MSASRKAIRTTAPVVVTLAVLLLGPSAAVADPPALNRDECSSLLAQATIWPGGIDDESGTTYRLVSDAFSSYLSAQSPCSSPEG